MKRGFIRGGSTLAIIAHPCFSSHAVDLIVINLSMLRPIAFQTDSTNRFKGINCFKDVIKAKYSVFIVDKVVSVWNFELHITENSSIDIIHSVRLRTRVGYWSSWYPQIPAKSESK